MYVCDLKIYFTFISFRKVKVTQFGEILALIIFITTPLQPTCYFWFPIFLIWKFLLGKMETIVQIQKKM
jgi:hypothetical protein